jgi:hypothetical protein
MKTQEKEPEKIAEIPEGRGDLKIVEEPPEADNDGAEELDGAAESEAQPARAAAPGKRPGRPGSREERRNLYRENEAIRQQVAQIPQLIARMQEDFRRDIAAIRQTAQPQQGQQGGQGGAQESPRVMELRRAMAAELKLMRTDANYDGGDRWLDLQQKLQEAIIDDRMTKREAAARAQAQAQGAGQRQEDPVVVAQQTYRYNALTTEFPWMLHPQYGRFFTGMVGEEYAALRRTGRPDSLDLHREAAARVAANLRLAAPAARDARRERVRTGYGDGGESNGTVAPREVHVPRAMLQGLELPESRISAALFRRDET